jgi:hypothetical protein
MELQKKPKFNFLESAEDVWEQASSLLKAEALLEFWESGDSKCAKLLRNYSLLFASYKERSKEEKKGVRK